MMMLVGAGLWSLTAVAGVAAQVCGDADGSGTVTVTDGVQVLRSAAGLSTTCSATPANCDVDGSGSATVSDGVNVLRKAAGIAITEACPSGGSSDVQEVTDAVLPFLTLGLNEVPNVSLSSAGATVRPAATENCEDGGTRTTDQSGVTVTVTFAACKVSEPGLGSFQLDGVIEVSLGLSSTVEFELNITDLGNSRLVDFDGTIQGTPRLGGGFVVNGGPIAVRESEGGPEVFRLTFDDLTVDGDGTLVSGSVEAEDTSDSFDLKTAEVEVEDSSTTATVRVVRDDDSEEQFLLNLETGELTPAS
jgi:hypothetical protein